MQDKETLIVSEPKREGPASFSVAEGDCHAVALVSVDTDVNSSRQFDFHFPAAFVCHLPKHPAGVDSLLYN
jgi:hypothetical protein